MMIEGLSIFLNEIEVGTLTQLPDDRHIFSFHQDYIDNENRPILSQSFKNIYGGLVTSTKPTQHRLPPFFSNLLPEGILREYLAKQSKTKPEREFFLLKTLGQDLPGAIKAIPTNMPLTPDEQENIFHFSLAGIQLKFPAIKGAVVKLEDDSRFAIPANGVGGSWIVKLPDFRYTHVPENEFAMMSLAKAVGIDTVQRHLLKPTHRLF